MDSIVGSKTCVYVGSSARDYEALLFKDPECPARYLGTVIGTSLLTNIISWFYDPKGLIVVLDTACSGSLSALHPACQSLRNYESDLVRKARCFGPAGNSVETDTSQGLAGGCNLILALDVSMVHPSNMGFFSPDGRCLTFDQRAKGYAKGKGAGMAVIKLLENAIEDVDTIRAVIRTTGFSQDCKIPGLMQGYFGSCNWNEYSLDPLRVRSRNDNKHHTALSLRILRLAAVRRLSYYVSQVNDS